MSAPVAPSLPSPPSPLARLVRAGLLTGISDGLFASVLSVFFYHSTVMKLWQGVASVLLGKEAMNGGAKTAVIGVLMHFGVAFTWSAILLFALMRAPSVRRLVATPQGILKAAAIYGPFIWLFMSLIVIPTFAHRAPAITSHWWTQLVGHIPFVALPMIAALVGSDARATAVPL